MAVALPATAGVTVSGIATAGAVAGGTMAAGGVVYASKNSGQSSSKKVKTDYSVSPNGVTEPIGDGQHILERHVGKRDDELWTRLKNNATITGASTFTDDFSANYVVKQALQDSNNINKINKWLAKGANGNLPLQYKGNDIIGRGVSRNSTNVQYMTNAKIILKSNKKGGYDILTAYPSK
jgi:hypothetical protein